MLEKLMHRLVCGAAAACLAACGGGDDRGGDAREPNGGVDGDLRAESFIATADTAMETLQSSASLSSLVLSASPATVGTVSRRTARRHPLYALHRLVADPLAGRVARKQAVGSFTDYDESYCDSGRLLIAVEYGSDTGHTVGDHTTVTSDACVVNGNPVVGRITGTLTAFRKGSNNSVQATVNVDFAAFGHGQFRADGRTIVDLSYPENGDSHFVLAYEDFRIGAGPAARTWRHRVTLSYLYQAEATTMSFAGTVLIDGRRYEVSQEQAFELGEEEFPTRGLLRMRDADGDRLEVQAEGSWLSYRLFLARNAGSRPDASARRTAPLW
ncbi:hypothetical protein OOT46_18825 [Aquabacterium sp. A7-Y]|uniref:hypothetical protein n=1 Tax=Aquabacterium sp. A7-Y TaxID=1349605 RepID=UPI00223E3EB7|nr:hypothetical protein [Aquabacterium sp. A7-Y]MCW7539893.1 hypothetical protein [Aquabacterium sp. A7-Y]